MGITGLLPALKSIQVTKHLSDFKGKTVAVDAYVWLHKAVYSCAIELATGRETSKYVHYCMHRVRMLRHHGIEPYIVFDGGPLPAKMGTEKERKQKREENLAKGNAMLTQGKATQARDYFIKCVDVTPQMAYQFIKALKAESVQYIVAPYEADAQLAYLERKGTVDAILTEDSDLLVFGCQTVLLKFDPTAATVTCISRKDFGSVTTSDSNPISLVGWSDVEFRAMAILSGCDYLPSIQGIGLKTACSLLKKWKTPEKVVKAIIREGKKTVPPGYMKQYRLADKCFQHQRVFCPTAERLVHLTEVGPDWNEEFDAYVGSDIDPCLAKKISLGDCDPVTHQQMEDINPNFLPRILKPLPPVSNNPNRATFSSTLSSLPLKGKIKGRNSLPTVGKLSTSDGGILNFFGPNPIIPSNQKSSTSTKVKLTSQTGKASGKRTLADVMDHDIEQKKRQCKTPTLRPTKSTHSKFFAESTSSNVKRRHSEGVIAVAGPSQPRIQPEDKENVYIFVDDDDEITQISESELDATELSMRAHYDTEDINTQELLELSVYANPVEQEDGYISPTPSRTRDADDISSPAGPRRFEGKQKAPGSDLEEDDDSFGAQIISSPISVEKLKSSRWNQIHKTPSRNNHRGAILVEPTPTPRKRIYPDADDIPSPTVYRGPDLRKMIGEDNLTELEGDIDIVRDRSNTGILLRRTGSSSASSPSPSPEMPDPSQSSSKLHVEVIDVDEFDYGLDDNDRQRAQQISNNVKTVMNGWREKWAMHSKNTKSTSGVQKTASFGSQSRQFSANNFNPGSTPIHTFSLKRSDANITPATGSSISAYTQPRSAPTKMSIKFYGADSVTGNTSIDKRYVLNEPDIDEIEESMPYQPVDSVRHTKQGVLSSTKAKLSQYR